MNQDIVKQKLLDLRTPKEDFSVIFSGKESRKVNGLYHPESREIILHNRNFPSDNALMYTAIHEYAHHIHCTEAAVPVGRRAHTTAYWSIFHSLLFRAEELGIYDNVFETNEEFVALTERIKTEFLTKNGQLIRDFGKVLIEVEALCTMQGASFTDYLDRVLKIPRESATSIMKSHIYQIEPELGYDNMKTLTGIRDPETRNRAQTALLEGQTPAMVKEQFKTRKQAEGEIDALRSEKSSIEHRIQLLADRLKEIEARLRDAEFRTVAQE